MLVQKFNSGRKILRSDSPCRFNSIIKHILIEIEMKLDIGCNNTASGQINNDINFHKHIKKNASTEKLVCYTMLYRESSIVFKQNPFLRPMTWLSRRHQFFFINCFLFNCFQHRSFSVLLKNACSGVWTIHRSNNNIEFRLCDSGQQDTGKDHEYPNRHQYQCSKDYGNQNKYLYKNKNTYYCYYHHIYCHHFSTANTPRRKFNDLGKL